MSDIQDEAYSEAMEEIDKLGAKIQYQDEAYNEAMEEIARLKAQVVRLDAQIKWFEDGFFKGGFKSLFTRAADALVDPRSERERQGLAGLISELRKAAE